MVAAAAEPCGPSSKFEDIYRLLAEGCFPPSFGSIKRKNLKRYAQKFVVDGGERGGTARGDSPDGACRGWLAGGRGGSARRALGRDPLGTKGPERVGRAPGRLQRRVGGSDPLAGRRRPRGREDGCSFSAARGRARGVGSLRREPRDAPARVPAAAPEPAPCLGITPGAPSGDRSEARHRGAGHSLDTEATLS